MNPTVTGVSGVTAQNDKSKNVEEKCPNCDSKTIEVLEDGRKQCLVCYYIWE